MDEKKYKKQFKMASCGRAPWASVIEPHNRDSVMRQIRLECLQIYGYAIDTCPKRAVCLGQSCLGRELPWKSPTAKPYLEKMRNLGMLSGEEYIVNSCSDCPIRDICKTPCAQMNDFINRHQSKQPELVYQENIDNHAIEASEEASRPSLFEGLKIPWDCLGATREAIVRLRLYDRKDFLTIARKCQLYDQSTSRFEFYSALTKLAEYAILREFIKEKGDNLTLDQNQILTKRYIHNMDLVSIAKDSSTTKQNISQIINRIITKNKISWPKYVKKQGNKVIYSIPQVLQ